MEKLNYSIEDSTIAEILGVQNFSTEESAVLELVKNAYDAGAQQITLEFLKNSLVITDNGKGMDADDIKKHWMHVGKSEKKYEIYDIKGHRRILAGSKGVGRFALARLGKSVRFESKKADSMGVVWNTDWNTSYLDEDVSVNNEGSKIFINDLRDKWGKKKIQNLHEFLSKMYNDDAMKITISYDGICEDVLPYFSEPVLGQNCLSIIDISYDSRQHTLYTSVKSDEFQEEAKKYCDKIDINKLDVETNIVDEINFLSEYEISESEIRNHLLYLGDFSAQFYFYVNSSNEDCDRYLYKYSRLEEKMKPGLILYRNAFGISNYEGKKDWLELGKRSRKSPAAATHPTGAWRVRENQLSGKVEIDKDTNKVLKELSNRQGLEEDIYYKLFIAIVQIGINNFERYRQSIIRLINKKNKEDKKTSIAPVSSLIIKKPELVSSLSKTDTKLLVDELKEFKKANREYQKEQERVANRYKYDIRILNVLATVGLKASSIAHEMKNDRNSIAENVDYIIDALKEYNMWDELNLPINTSKAYKNIPLLLERNDKVNKKLLAFMNTMLDEIEQNQFKSHWQSVIDIIIRVQEKWQRDYSWVSISIITKEDICFYVSEDVMQVIFDNLILNSIQQNKAKKDLNIKIEIKQEGSELTFIYSDNGKGLHEKYLNNPDKILEVHETTRENGHGLGMWIVNNTVNMTNGEIKKIIGQPGFMIEFCIGGSEIGKD